MVEEILNSSLLTSLSHLPTNAHPNCCARIFGIPAGSSRFYLPPRIDNEFRRERSQETERKWAEQQEKWSRMEPHIPTGYIIEDETVEGFIADGENSINFMRRKDEMMAANDPMRYCADRCVTTGNCDVFEVSLIPSKLRQLDKDDLLTNSACPGHV